MNTGTKVTTHDKIELPEHDCLYESTNEQGYIDLEPAYRKSTVLRLLEADRQDHLRDAANVIPVPTTKEEYIALLDMAIELGKKLNIAWEDAIKASTPVVQEPVGEVFTMEPLDGSGDVRSHVILTKPLPAGT